MKHRLLALVILSLYPPIGHAQLTRCSSTDLRLSARTRLLVVAPHPDDETLGAGGVIQRAATEGGIVRIVYLTDGDGYPEGVKVHDHIRVPVAGDFRGYGQVRQQEARKAAHALGIAENALIFLGFPDGGLAKLTVQYWSNRKPPYESPFTRQHQPRPNESVLPNIHYRGEDLTQELARVFDEFQPTMVVVPRKEDEHPDHCAASYFTDDAIADVTRVHSSFHTELVNYLVHFDDWTDQPQPGRLMPPAGLAGGVSGWIAFPLSTTEQERKHAALMHYETQVHVMTWFLHTFVRSNELFSRPAPLDHVLPLRTNPCGQ